MHTQGECTYFLFKFETKILTIKTYGVMDYLVNLTKRVLISFDKGLF